MSKFQTIGGAWINTSKTTGKKFISLSLNPGVVDAIAKEDIEKKLCLFRADKKNEKSPDFNVSAPMPDDFKPSYQKPQVVEEDKELGIWSYFFLN